MSDIFAFSPFQKQRTGLFDTEVERAMPVMSEDPYAEYGGFDGFLNMLSGRRLQRQMESERRRAAGSGFALGQAQANANYSPDYGANYSAIGAVGGGDGTAYGQPLTGDAVNQTSALLREFEGFRETPYWDVNALRSGYGSDTVTLADGSVQRVTRGTRVSRADGERDLNRRVSQEFLPRVRRAVGPAYDALAPNQQAALGSIAYNYGSLPNSVARAVQTPGFEDDYQAILALAAHNKGVNAKRRRREAAIYAGVF